VAVADVGGTRLRVALFDPQGKIITQSEGPTPRTDVFNSVINAVTAAAKDYGMVAACLGIPGIPTQDGGRIAYCHNVPSLESVPLASLASEALEIPVVVKNDVELAAIGEYSFGTHAGSDPLVNISVGTGLGCGIITGGKPWRGAHGLGSEIAEWRVWDPWSSDVKRAEDVCSGLALSSRAGEILGEMGGRQQLDKCEVLFNAAAGGHKEARRALSNLGKVLGAIIASIGGLLDPDVVILNGGVMKAGDFIVEDVYSVYRQASIGAARDTVSIAISNLGDLAPLLGGFSSIVTELWEPGAPV
jgi:glucokinase